MIETISSLGKIIKANPENHPKSFKQLLGYLSMNNGRDCFAKFQGKVWMITKEGTWKFVCKNIPDLTFNEYLKLSKE